MLVGWWLVSGVSGKSQSSIVLLTIENVRPLVVDDGRRWVSLEGHVRKSSSQFSEGSKRVLSH